jgi:hypothetical protein
VFAARFVQASPRDDTLRFAITSRPSRCEEDFHLQATDPARHTKENAPRRRGASGQNFCWYRGYFFFAAFFAGFFAFFAIDRSPLISNCSLMHRVLIAR